MLIAVLYIKFEYYFILKSFIPVILDQMHAFKCVWICVILNKNHITKTKYNLPKFLIVMCVGYELTISYKASLKIFTKLLFLSDGF